MRRFKKQKQKLMILMHRFRKLHRKQNKTDSEHWQQALVIVGIPEQPPMEVVVIMYRLATLAADKQL